MDFEVIGFAIGIFLLRVLGNALTTFRLILLTRGQRFSSSVLAFFESLLFAVVLGAVVSNLESLLNLFAYSGGFAVGGYVGMWLEDKFSLGYVQLGIISREKGREVAKAIRKAGFGATEIAAHGAEGAVVMIESIVERHTLEGCLNVVQKVDPEAVITTQSLKGIRRGFVPIRPGLTRLFNTL